MHLNTLSPGWGSRKPKRRLGRGAGSGHGKTSGKGHKGQKARKSGNVRPGFEGGQMELQVRIPKFGFRSRLGMSTAEVRLGELAKVDGDQVDIESLKRANVLKRSVKRARIVLSGSIERPVVVRGIKVTKGARAAIEAAGGKVED
jgi:large subunit ribosomal protein L15